MTTPGLGSLLDGAEEETRRRLQEDAKLQALDIVDYAQSRFYIEETAAPIVLLPHQQAVLRYPFRRLVEGDSRIARFPSLATRLGHFPFTTVVESTIKKGGKCVAVGEEILLATGDWVEVSRLVGSSFEVLSFEESTKTFQLAVAHASDNGLQPCVEIVTKLGRRHIRTVEHPFLTLEGWVAAKDLGVGSKIAVPLALDKIKSTDTLSNDELTVLAFMLGDGCLVGNYSFSQAPGPALDEYKRIMDSWGLVLRHDDQGYDYTPVNPNGRRWLGNRLLNLCRDQGIRGCRSATKFVPSAVYRSSNEKVALFLNRLYACDGWVSEQEIGYSSDSVRLAKGVHRLLMKLGIQARLSRGASDSRHTQYHWQVTIKDRMGVLQFSSQVGILGKEEQLRRAEKLAEERWQQRVRQVDVFSRSAWNRLDFQVSGKRRWPQETGIGKPAFEQEAPRRELVKTAAKNLGDKELLAYAEAPVGWDEVVSVEQIGIRQTVSLEVPQYHTFVTETIEHNTTLSAVVARFFLDTQTRFGEIYCCGNDFDQARERAFKFVNISLRLTPGCKQRGSDWIIPGQFTIQKMRIDNLLTGSRIIPISVDARGEAGGNPDLTVWTELWGFDHEEARRFWQEMTPPPTKIDSIRLVETYAGYDGESELLKNEIYDLAKAGVQLTAGELAEATDTPLDAFEETGGNPDELVPVWVNEQAGLFMYWDSGLAARRMPWQRGSVAEAYYREQALKLPPPAFSRLHDNLWTGGESEFVPIELWDSCQEDLPPFRPDTPESAVLAVDAAVTGDCFGIVAITRHPIRHDDVAVRRVKKWDPKESGGLVNYQEPERFLRALCKGSCAAGHPPMEVLAGQHRYSEQQRAECESCRNGPYSPPYRITQIAYDPFQLESMMQGLRRDSVAWCEPFSQMADRLKSDRLLYDLIMNHRIAHDGDPALREHIMNAKAKHQKDQDSTMRLVKKSTNRKIDLAVCASMGAFRCLYLLL